VPFSFFQELYIEGTWARAGRLKALTAINEPKNENILDDIFLSWIKGITFSIGSQISEVSILIYRALRLSPIKIYRDLWVLS
jgi:hypothetical protein